MTIWQCVNTQEVSYILFPKVVMCKVFQNPISCSYAFKNGKSIVKVNCEYFRFDLARNMLSLRVVCKLDICILPKFS